MSCYWDVVPLPATIDGHTITLKSLVTWHWASRFWSLCWWSRSPPRAHRPPWSMGPKPTPLISSCICSPFPTCKHLFPFFFLSCFLKSLHAPHPTPTFSVGLLYRPLAVLIPIDGILELRILRLLISIFFLISGKSNIHTLKPETKPHTRYYESLKTGKMYWIWKS